MATATKEQYDTITAVAEALEAAKWFKDTAAMIREAQATPRREVVTFERGGAVLDNEPITTFRDGRPVTFANKHAYYKAWYQEQLGLTEAEAEACAAEAVARIKPKPTTLSAAEKFYCDKLGVTEADYIKFNS